MINRLIQRIFGSSLLILLIIIPAAIFIPGGDEIEVINTILTISGILYAIIVGLFITDLWSRYEKIRSSVAAEVSGITTYYAFVKLLGPRTKKWQEEQADLIEAYVRKFVSVQWHEYEQTDPEFNQIMDSLKELKMSQYDKDRQTYNNLLSNIASVSDAREELIILGKDRLSMTSWFVTIFLSLTLLFSLFYINDNTLVSVIFTSLLTSIIIFLLLTLKDLNDLQKGEEAVSFEPYEKIFDAIGKPRYYRQEDLESGRVKVPKDKKFEIEKED